MLSRNTPIRRKLMAALLLTAGAVLLPTCAAFITYEVVTLRRALVEGYRVRAEIIADNSTAALAFQDPSDAARILGAFQTDRRVMEACLYDARGRIFAKYPAGAPDGAFPAGPGTSGFRRGWLDTFCPVSQRGRRLGTVYLRTDLAALTDRYRAYAGLVAAIIAGSLLLAFLLSRLLQKQISQPILALAETARVVSDRRDFSVRAPKFGGDELGLLTDAFNRMLSEILEQDKALKASEANYREIFEKANEGILVQELETGRILDLNRKAVEMLGFSREEWIGLEGPAALSTGRPGFTAEDAASWMKKASEEGPQMFEWQGRHKDGGLRWLEVGLTRARIAGQDRLLAFFRDIGDRKKAEESLAERTRLLDLVLKSMSEGVVVADHKGTMTFYNAASSRISGLGLSAQDSSKWAEEYGVFREDQVTPCPESEIPLVKAVRGEATDGAVLFLRNPAHPEGVFVSVNGRPLRDERGDLVGGLVVVRDITQQRKNEELLKSRSLFQGLLESAPDAVVIVDEGGKITLVNSQTERLFGYPRAELIGREVEVLIPVRFRSGHVGMRGDFTREMRSRPRGLGMELFGLRKDGTEVPVEISLSPLKTAEGVLVSAAIRDITDRKKAEEQIRQTNEFLNAVLENIPNMIFVKDAVELRFVRFNRAGEELLGVPKEQVIGKNDYDFFPREQAEFFTAKDRDVLKEGRLLDIPEESIETRAKGERVLHTKKIPMRGKDGKPQYLLGISEDVTDLKNQERLRIYTKALEVSNKELQDFVFVVSHDLQEPLRKIQSFGNFLKEEAGPSLEGASADYLARMQDAAFRMGRLIEDLLQLTRITSRAKPFEPVELSRILSEVKSDLEIRIRESEGEVKAAGLPRIDADPSQMRQLFQNLVGNALKFRRKGTRPVVEVKAEADEKNNRCRIWVRDNGIGFDQKYADKVFNIFQRLNGAEYEGTGIGLSICRKVVERHHGTITASSRPGEGAVFEITLPIRQ